MLDSFSSEELLFIKAIDRYKSENNKNFLSWTEVLKIFKELGYRRTCAGGSDDSHSRRYSGKKPRRPD